MVVGVDWTFDPKSGDRKPLTRTLKSPFILATLVKICIFIRVFFPFQPLVPFIYSERTEKVPISSATPNGSSCGAAAFHFPPII